MHRLKQFKMQNFRFKMQNSKRLIYVLVAVLAFLTVTFNFSLTATAAAKHYTELQFAPLPEIKLPKYERYVLQNGLVVYLMEDHELPLVSGTAMVRAGSRWEPADKVGLASFTGAVMRTGGTKQHSPDKLNEILEQRAASVEVSINEAAASASFESLTEDVDTVFGLFAEIMQQPVFAQEKLDLAKTQAKGSIARRNDNPSDIASREFRKLIYGKDSPYGRITEYATVDAIAREDLVQFHQKYFYPNNTILGIVGDFDSKKMRSLIQAKFGSWARNPKFSKPTLPEVASANQGGVFFVNQPQLTQSSVLIGHLGGKFDSPDYAALDVLNEVFNGFGGRLFNELRSRQGLAYSVYGLWSPRFDYPGMFIAGGQTRSDATVQFVKALQAQIKRVQAQPVTAAELARAKDSTLNSFVFNFQDPAQTLSRLMRYEYYGYPADFLFRYQKAVAATTAADVQRVAKQYLKPDNLVTLVVGNQTAIQPPLTQLAAQVTPIDVTIPSSQARN
ncbi:insulinase family protein [Anabaena azotica FACHB-119]|uniref:Insulinase family protein n=2 Tax=Anabaena azotica TaxID=197653 RepID=A0ABR8D7P0_9NOST|nr:insulinase family protein [Anabaena azotica FACHB-119]